MPTLAIVIGSTRPGRVGLPVARWFEAAARQHGAFEIDVVDLAELALPFLDEPHHPRLRRYVHEHTRAWSARVEATDAFVLVHPEYNHGFNAPLKNAIDFLHHEWRGKPVGFVSYGGVSAGTRAMAMLKPVVTALGMVPVVDAVNLPFVQSVLEDGVLRPNEITTTAATTMLDELARVEAALRPLRARPLVHA
jgi:NAD(P)H-dependent FMN reductase